jgi:hypothetical protein
VTSLLAVGTRYADQSIYLSLSFAYVDDHRDVTKLELKVFSQSRTPRLHRPSLASMLPQVSPIPTILHSIVSPPIPTLRFTSPLLPDPLEVSLVRARNPPFAAAAPLRQTTPTPVSSDRAPA